MTRIILFLIAIGALALGASWLADRPGDVVVTWQGMRIETSVMVLGAAALATLALLMAVIAVVRAIFSSPGAFSRYRRRLRGERAYAAMSRGLIAVGAGDIDAARKHMADASRLAPAEPLTLLLRAQSAQLDGNRDAAEDAFRAMAGRPELKTLGLHGLFVEARRRGDHTAAHAFAEEAVNTAPRLGWAGRAVLEFRSALGDWAGALSQLERNRGAFDKPTYQRQRAVLLTARAEALQDTDPEAARAFALEAHELAPTLVPAATLAGRLLAEAGYWRKANRVIDRAWRANPHPDLAQAYADLRYGDAARDRLKRIEALVDNTPGHSEGALAVARAALDAREFKKARAALERFLDKPTKRIALLMAELERAEHGDEGRAREWTARAVHAAPDPAWTADGHVSDRWLPASPVTGKLDAFEWRVPLTGTLSAPVIEPEPPPPSPAPSPPPPALTLAPTPLPEIKLTSDEPAETSALTSAFAKASKASSPDANTTDTTAAPATAKLAADLDTGIDGRPDSRTETTPVRESAPPPVIPLIHAPDDPGPDGDTAIEPEPPRDKEVWRKLFG
jgi:HemY protein